MSRVTVELPSVLAPLVDGNQTLAFDAATLPEVLTQLTDSYPALGPRLFDEAGRFREHVLCFHNETSTRWLDSLDVGLSDGDVISILQAVSGG